MKQAKSWEGTAFRNISSSGRFSSMGSQVTFRFKSGGKWITSRIDMVGKGENGMFKLLDAKFGNASLTKNQKLLQQAIQNGEDVIPVGQKAKDIFGASNTGKSATNLLEKGIEIVKPTN